jgi:hypothetical protein
LWAASLIWWSFILLCRSFLISCSPTCQSFLWVAKPFEFYVGSHCLCLLIQNVIFKKCSINLKAGRRGKMKNTDETNHKQLVRGYTFIQLYQQVNTNYLNPPIKRQTLSDRINKQDISIYYQQETHFKTKACFGLL